MTTTRASIVFDLDGTLIDSAPDIRAGANQLLKREGKAPLSMAETHSFSGRGAAVFVAEMCAARGIPASQTDRLHQAFLALYEAQVDLTHPYPNVVAALAELAAQGHALGICTNKPIAPTHAVLNHLGLADFFETVWGGDSLPVRKPDPAPLHAAFDALTAQAQIYVGDSETDAETARRAGIPFLLFTEGYRKTDAQDLPHTALFDDFAQLPGLVRETLAALTDSTLRKT